MIIIHVALALSVLAAALFWQPAMGERYQPSTPYRKPTKIERYISYINRMIGQGNYSIAAELLANTKHPKDQLPWDYWAEEIGDKLAEALAESKKIENLRKLEKILAP